MSKILGGWPTGGWLSWRVLVHPRPSYKNISAGIGDCHVSTRLVVLRTTRAATQRQCCVQAAAVGSFTSIYACGSRIRAGCSRHPSRYCLRLQRLRISRPVVHDGLERFHASRHVRAHAYPTFSRMNLSRSAVLLVSPGWSPMASSCISILRCRATAGSSGRQCVFLARYWNIHNSRAGASTGWSFSHVAGRCTCVLWAASNIKLVRHDGRVR